jgi:hypothetical protein
VLSASWSLSSLAWWSILEEGGGCDRRSVLHEVKELKCSGYTEVVILIIENIRDSSLHRDDHGVLSSVPRLPAWSFLRRINRGVLPLRIPFDRLRAAVSPIDTP